MNWNEWHAVGLGSQLVFGSRFLVQWLISERRGQSVIPTYFWYASLLGSVGLLAYAIHIKDPIFILGQSFGFVVYMRNLMLRRQPRP
jgi:lipid-A-disaccharide synthase-like uncharacterized protein